MKIKTAEFLVSNTDVKDCPNPDKPEYAFIGRSNVGKSSLINMLCNKKKLAKTSSTPGKTQLINHFVINDHWFLVDLPGYGYAKVSKADRKKWDGMSHAYLKKRKNLMCVFVLIDSRIPPQKIDLEFIQTLGENMVPFVIAYTKTDKLKSEKLKTNISNIETAILQDWEELPQRFITSSESGLGKDEILSFIDGINKSQEKEVRQ